MEILCSEVSNFRTHDLKPSIAPPGTRNQVDPQAVSRNQNFCWKLGEFSPTAASTSDVTSSYLKSKNTEIKLI
jgi:hypothetical protein